MPLFRFRTHDVREDETLSTYLIVGLGNPGREYRNNRHNAGYMVIDKLSATLEIRLSRIQSRAMTGSGKYHDSRIILAKPQTFMNLSGQAVSSLLKFYRVPLTNLLAIHDDLDLPVGALRIRPGGGSAGQKGLASIIQQLGTQEFPRLRIGIGRPPGQMSGADYVLQDFSRDELDLIAQALSRAVQSVQVFIVDGIESAMNQFNGQADRGEV